MMKRIASLILFCSLFGIAVAATPADSISTYLGRTQGAMLNRRLASMPAADSRFKEGLLKGLAAILTADTAEVGYTEGISMGLAMLSDLRKFAKLGVNVDTRTVYRELRAGLLGPEPDEAAIAADNRTLSQLLMPMMQRAQALEDAARAHQREEYDSICTANLNAADAFTDSLRKADPDVKTLPSGLLYKVIEKGKGPNPKPDQTVDVVYTGTTIAGDVFDTSGDEPRQFMLGGVIRGFSEGLALMKPGAHYILYIPGELAYGAKGIPGKIEPMQMLIFDVRLTGIEKEKK